MPVTLAEVRQKYPQYNDLSDEQLAEGLHKKYYSDLPFEDFSQRIGLQTAAPAESTPQEQGSVASELGRSAAMQTGEAIKGGGSFFALPADLVTTLYNLASSHTKPYTVTMDDGTKRVVDPAQEPIKTLSQQFGESVDQVTPQPRNATERVTNSVVRALGGGATGVGAGKAIAGGVGQVLAAAPQAQAAGAIGGGATSQLVAEAGGGPIAQAVGGLVGGVAAAGGARAGISEGVRRTVRGGEASRQQMTQNVEAFENAGTTPSVGQATQSRPMQAAESLLSRAPGGAGVMAAKAEKQAAELGTNIERLASQLAPKASGEQAGRSITKGISGEGGFVDQFKAQSTANYDKLDAVLPKNSKFGMSNTQKALDELTQPIYGAERTSKFFINSKIAAIKDALTADLSAGGNGLPYEAVKKLRSIVGEQLADAPFNGDVPRSQWKRLYSAMSADIETSAKAIDAANGNNAATKLLERANAFHAAGMKRLDTISSVIDKAGGPEKVFQAATSGTKEGATTLRAVMQSLPPDAQKMVSASVLRRLGRATSGKQDDLGEKFSTETFLTNWNGMSPQAKGVLFDRYGEGFRRDMDQVAKVAANLRSGSKVFQNPSGTAQAAVQAGTAGGFVLSVLTGQLGTAGTIAGGVVGSNLVARLLVNPRAVKWLAQATKAPPAAVPTLINQAAQSGDPDLSELARVLAENQKQNRDDKSNRK